MEARITEGENSLTRRVKIEGMPSAKWTFTDRKFYHANGVSVAVKDYKIEWAKA